MNRDVVCQLPPEAGHPPHTAARYLDDGDKALRTCGVIATRADRCCYELYSIQSRERTPQRTLLQTPSQSGQQPQHVAPPPGEPPTQSLASQDSDGESEAVEPQSRTSNISTLQQREENPQNPNRKENKEGCGEAV